MSTLTPPKKISRRQELRQDKMVTASARVWEYVDQNRNVVYMGLGAVAVVALLIVGFTFYQGSQQNQASEALGSIVRYYESGDFQTALDGTADAMGLEAIASQYGGTAAGNLAKFYAADALMQLGDHDAALGYFRDFDKDNDLLGASALAGEAAVLELQENYRDAANRYEDAADQFVNDITSPEYLLDAGRAFEKAGAYNEALRVYNRVKEEFEDATAARSIDAFIARAQAML